MSVFKRGDRVRVIESSENSTKTYVIKKIFESDDGIPLYLLKSETSCALRLLYENEEAGLERVA
ncbi:MAG: hypothetical protein KGI02_06405 [Thaumarchaeota archaeon]|nr:hypothetical protein [Nitrososphaerota archaeon]MDE1831985.1 hypothetical protein [Nitrososphaerota archaeon]MDE1841513.1 hypothetical protein [Nitrososphaerota archaeon]MDE1878897.1 hypothetical protein [Nitrososphaerota archaeon]